MLGQIVCENIREEAQEIKKFLSNKNIDVDETVICELMESLDPNHKANRMEYIIDMIMDNQNFSQASSDKTIQSIEMQSQGTNTEELHKHNVHNSLTENTTIDVSDSEDDRDYYYSSNYDDNSVIDVSATSSLSGSVFNTAKETNNISNNNPITKTCVKVDKSEIEFLEAEIELLEENNNNDVIYMKSVKNEKSRLTESPKPGCSKDSDDKSQSFEDYCRSCDFNELQIDAKRIHTLLPNIDYDLIYKTLCNNQLAKNRIELTLWDLLQKERPSPQLMKNKRKYTPYEMHVKDKRNSDISPEKTTDTKNETNNQQIDVTPETVCLNSLFTTNDVNKDKDNSEKLHQLKKRYAKDTKIVLEKKEQACAENKTKTVDVEPKNRESMLVNETDKMKIDITEDIKTINNNMNNTDDTSNTYNDKNNASERNNDEMNNTNNDTNNTNNDAININNDVNTYGDANNTKNETNNQQMDVTLETVFVCSNPLFIDDINIDNRDNLGKLLPPKREGNPPKRVKKSKSKTLVEQTYEATVNPKAMVNHEAILDYRLPHKTEMDNMHPATMSTSMPSTSVSSTRQKIATPVLRPARLTVTEVPPIFTQVPILRPPKLHLDSKKFMDIENDLKRSTKAIKAEIKKEKLHEAVMMEHVPSPVRLSKLAKNNALLHNTQAEMATFDKILSSHLKKDRNNEEGNNFKQQNEVNAHRVYSTDGQKEKEDFMSSIGMETNKEKQSSSTNNTGEIILNEKSRKLYYQLIPMFPSVNTVYIKQLCQRHVADARLGYGESVLLQNLVEHLLEHGQKYPTKKPELLSLENNSSTYTLIEQYADLLGIFPEADPTHLRKVAEENYKDPEKIKEYVQSQLENPTYPTRAQALARKKITDQQKQYTSAFNIKQFLELFPDPFSHFENVSRQCKFNPHAVDFLKQFFSKIKVNTLLYTYTEHQHNLSLTAKALEALSPDMKSKRAHNKVMLTEDIPLLQECAFIQHKAVLKKYLTELKDQEEREFQKLKANNELIECQCCYDNECMLSKCSTCEDGHIFCNTCIIRSTELTLADGKTHVDCLLNCGNEFSLSVLQKILPPTKFSILLCKRQEAEVMAAGLEGLVSCPFCHFASIPPPEDKVFRCLNPNCMKESCRLCKELNHIPLKCDELKSDVARLYLEEKMTEALIRKCYKCGRTFFKEEGCNKMTCLCGAQMCYICDKPVVDYKHFQGQGVQDSNLCPLWSDDRRMNAESVIKVCHETLKHIKQKNPQVDINVAALLPKLPPKVKGPHEDIAFANAMPAHAERIARHNP